MRRSGRSGRGARRARHGAPRRADARRRAAADGRHRALARRQRRRDRGVSSRAASSISDFAVVRFQLAQLLQAKGQLREAEQRARRARSTPCRRTPRRRSSWRRCAARLGRARRGAAAAHRAAAARPLSLRRAASRSARRCSRSGRKRDAAHAFARVLRFDPSHVGALFHEGVILAEQHRYRDAIERWQRVIELEPDERLRAARAPRDPHGDRSAARLRHRAEAASHGDRRPASRARHSRRLPAARSEPEDGRAARDVGAARRRGRRRVRRRPRRARGDPQQGDADRDGAAAGGKITEADLETARARAGERARRSATSASLLVEIGAITQRELERQLRCRSRAWCSS